MSGAAENGPDVAALARELAELRSLFQRRLLDDKPKNQLIEQVQRHLAERDALERGEAFASLFSELLLAVDRLQQEEASTELNNSVVLELLEVLARRGVTPLPPAAEFDPRVHELVARAPVADGAQPGAVVEVRRPGYALGDKLLRATQVVVAEPGPGDAEPGKPEPLERRSS